MAGSESDILGDLIRLVRYGAHRTLGVTVDGTTVRFRTADAYSRRWFFPRYANGKTHEEAVTLLMAKHMRDAHCFVDVGANLGFFTCLASRLMPDGTVFAFEMNDHFHALLSENIELNAARNVHAFRAAVTDAAGQVHYRRQQRARYRPTLRLEPGGSGRQEFSCVSVASIALDEFFNDRDEQPDLVKIDVEGAEMLVLRGMERLLSSESLKLFIELHPVALQSFESSARAVTEMLLDRGYDLVEIADIRKSGAEADLRRVDHTSDFSTNTMLFAEKRLAGAPERRETP